MKEDATKMHRTKNSCRKIVDNGESVMWVAMTW